MIIIKFAKDKYFLYRLGICYIPNFTDKLQ